MPSSRLLRAGLLVAALVAALGPLAAGAEARALHALGFRACIEDAGLDGCGTGTANEAPRLNGARGVAVSPDGRSVYQLRLAVTGADGQRAVDTARLRITR